MWQKAASQPRTDHSLVFTRWLQCASSFNKSFLEPTRVCASNGNYGLDRFIRFYRTHQCAQLTVRHTHADQETRSIDMNKPMLFTRCGVIASDQLTALCWSGSRPTCRMYYALCSQSIYYTVCYLSMSRLTTRIGGCDNMRSASTSAVRSNSLN